MKTRRRDLLKLAGGVVAASLIATPMLYADSRAALSGTAAPETGNGFFDVWNFGAVGVSMLSA